MRAHHTTRLFSWLPIPSQWAGRVLKFTSILFHDIFIKLPSLNCISGLHGFFLCLHTIVNRAGYMELLVGYFAFQCSLFFSGGSLCVHPFIRCFSRFLPCISPESLVCAGFCISEKANFFSLSRNSDDSQKICRTSSYLLWCFTSTWWITLVDQMLLQNGTDSPSTAVPGIVVWYLLHCVCSSLKSAFKVMPTAVLVTLQCKT